MGGTEQVGDRELAARLSVVGKKADVAVRSAQAKAIETAATARGWTFTQPAEPFTSKTNYRLERPGNEWIEFHRRGGGMLAVGVGPYVLRNVEALKALALDGRATSRTGHTPCDEAVEYMTAYSRREVLYEFMQRKRGEIAEAEALLAKAKADLEPMIAKAGDLLAAIPG